MTEIFDKSIKRIAIAENAMGVSEQQKINSLWHMNFSLPCNDPKNEFCQPFNLVRHNGGELYRIMPSSMEVDDTGNIEYECEHVLATLIDNVLFGYHVVGNLGVYTDEVIRYILDKQIVKNWVLDRCDFKRQFEYGWEQETLLSALFSVATPMSNYMWKTDTSIYPWKISLLQIDPSGIPEMYVRRKHNMLSYHRDRDPQQIVTRLYPLGYGEGVNQLGIASVNNGIPYLQSPKSITDKYGIVERVWIDRRYENAESLKAAAQEMLNQLQEPVVSYEVGFQELGQSEYDNAEVGKRVRIVYPEIGEHVDTIITEVNKEYDDITKSNIVVANKSKDVAESVAEMADRQRIESSYAQGATQIYSQALQANCDANSGAVMDFFVPSEMRIINKVLVKIRIDRFRAYSKSTSTKEANVVTSDILETTKRTSSSGGGTSTTTGSGGGTYSSTDSGGGEVATSSAKVLSADSIFPQDAAQYEAATHNHGVASGLKLALWGGKDANGNVISDGYATFVESGAHKHGEHDHEVRIPSHRHDFEVRDHSHIVEIRDHTHEIEIPGHSHKVTVPAHDHEITPGIYRFGNPKSFSLYIEGVKKETYAGSSAELDITGFLVDEDTSKIPRGRWMSVEVRPDDLAYVSIDLIFQGFVQSRGDNTV